MNNHFMEAALAYSRQGRSVIPLEPDSKKAAVSWKEFQTRRATENEIRSWWTTQPDYNVGIVTGAISGLSVIDLDGSEAFMSLETYGIELPDTYTVKTPHGQHRYYEHTEDITTQADVLTGIDTRGEGGYVVAPPSVLKDAEKGDGTYTVLREQGVQSTWPPDLGPLGPLGPLDRLKKSSDSISQWADLLETGSPEGKRNSDAASLVGHFHRMEMPADEIEILLSSWMKKSNEGADHEFDSEELKSVIKSITSKKSRKSSFDWSNSIVLMSDVKAREVKYLWTGRVAYGSLTVLAGVQGQGKTFNATWLMCQFSNGGRLPDSFNIPSHQGNSLILTTEDGVADTLKTRFTTMGADQTKIHAFDMEKVFSGGLPNLERDVEALEDYIVLHDIKLLILDPLTGLVGGSDDNSNTKMRNHLGPLVSMIQRRGIACIGILHMNKDTNQTNPLQKIMGSTALAALPRSVLAVMPDPDDQERHFLVSLKMNMAKPPKSLAYRLDEGKVTFESEPIDLDIYSLFNKQPSSSSEVTRAMEYYEDALANGQRSSTDLLSEWTEVECGSEASLKKARKQMGLVKTRKSKEGGKKGEGEWYWSLPDQGDQEDQDQGASALIPLMSNQLTIR